MKLITLLISILLVGFSAQSQKLTSENLISDSFSTWFKSLNSNRISFEGNYVEDGDIYGGVGKWVTCSSPDSCSGYYEGINVKAPRFFRYTDNTLTQVSFGLEFAFSYSCRDLKFNFLKYENGIPKENGLSCRCNAEGNSISYPNDTKQLFGALFRVEDKKNLELSSQGWQWSGTAPFPKTYMHASCSGPKENNCSSLAPYAVEQCTRALTEGFLSGLESALNREL